MSTDTLHDPLLHGAPARDLTGASDDRLARLQARSAARRRELGAPPPAPAAAGATGRAVLPPPPPGARPVPGVPSPPPMRRAARRHPAKGSRTVALVLSVGTTIALSGWFKAQQDAQSGSLDAAATALTGAAVGGTASGTAASASTPAATGVSASAAAPSTVTEAAGSTAAPTTPTTAGAATTVAATEPVAATALADGTWTGATDVNRWGPVQVAITVSGGSITDVAVLQYPDDDRKSVAINQQALPYLEQEVLAAQSADIDTVSGATYTTDSYQVSLQSAIDAARAAAG